MTHSDPISENAEQSGDGNFKAAKPRAGAVFSPEFREGAADNNRPKKFINPQDRRNFLLGFLAVVVFLVIFCLLEFKQFREANLEKSAKGSSVPESAQGQ